ncbi:magnesium transporter CorA family protein [Promineifilum sp.]|uniref:magnesium transporter CorA family protein n=1 Tax=Promineifilum sp. TaxID=2664178 RepID=UPI0035ADEB5C
MISIYRDGQWGLQPVETYDPGTWIHIENPSDEEIAHLCKVIALPETFLKAALDQREVARSDSKNNTHMVIVRAPYDFGTQDRVPYRTVPLGMVVTPDHFITICRHPIDFVRDLNYNYDEGELHTHRTNRMILAILSVVANWFLLYLEEIDKRLEDVEDRLKDSIENSEMLELLRYEKSLVYMKTGLEWNDQMVQHLQDKTGFSWRSEDREMFKDVRVEYRQGFYMADTMLTVLGEMADAYTSLISNNLNVVMKFLAAVTIVLALPTLVSSVYGMNVSLPGESFERMFIVILILAVCIAAVVAWWFHRRGWLSFHWRQPDKN